VRITFDGIFLSFPELYHHVFDRSLHPSLQRAIPWCIVVVLVIICTHPPPSSRCWPLPCLRRCSLFSTRFWRLTQTPCAQPPDLDLTQALTMVSAPSMIFHAITACRHASLTLTAFPLSSPQALFGNCLRDCRSLSYGADQISLVVVCFRAFKLDRRPRPPHATVSCPFAGSLSRH
jgi:hypothetical protein